MLASVDSAHATKPARVERASVKVEALTFQPGCLVVLSQLWTASGFRSPICEVLTMSSKSLSRNHDVSYIESY
jgi:hypothetical protein